MTFRHFLIKKCRIERILSFYCNLTADVDGVPTLTLSIGISKVVRTCDGGEQGVVTPVPPPPGGGLSTMVTRGLASGLVTFRTIPFLCCGGGVGDGVCGGGGDKGNSTIGLGVLVGTKSDWPVDRKMPFRTGHGAWLHMISVGDRSLDRRYCVIFCGYVALTRVYYPA